MRIAHLKIAHLKIAHLKIAHLKIAVFALILATPILALAAFGSAEEYGGASHPQFPRLRHLVSKVGQLDQFGEALLHRSPAMRQAIRLRSWIGYRLVGFVDTDRIVSGEGGWLFHRSEFNASACLNEASAARKLAELAALTDLGRAAGVDMIIGISPDKSTIYPEYLSRLARGYWRCQARDIPLLRRLIRQHAPLMLDHAEPILAEKARHPDVPLYYVADTHWTPLGAALALWQLLEAAFPGAAIPQPTLSDTTMSRTTDLTRMLLLPVTDVQPIPDPAWQAGLRAFNRDAPDVRTVIVHDSFYELLRERLSAVFPNLTYLDFRSPDGDIAAAIASADRLIVNSVERLFFSRMRRGGLSWDASIGLALMKRNRLHAESCGGFAPASVAAEADTAADETGAETGGETGGDPGLAVAVPVGSPEQLPCLRLALADPKAGEIEILLPDASGAFVPGRSFRTRIGPADRSLTVVLPDSAASAGIRVHVTGETGPAGIGAIEIGAVARPRLATAP